jgi:hypothetical protein
MTARLGSLSQESLLDQPHVKKIDLGSYNCILQVLAISHAAEPTPVVSVIFIHVMLAVLCEYLVESTREIIDWYFRIPFPLIVLTINV